MRMDVLRAAAIQLFVEALGIEGVRGRGDGGQSGESDEGGKDRLHGDTPKCCFPKYTPELEFTEGSERPERPRVAVPLLGEQTLTAVPVRRRERGILLD